MTQDQLKTCIELDKAGMTAVRLPHGPDSPVPGLILFSDLGQTQLLLVQPDGSTVDLLAVHRAAEDTVRNWGKGSSAPAFVGDWRRLILLANAVNGLPEPLGEPK